MHKLVGVSLNKDIVCCSPLVERVCGLDYEVTISLELEVVGGLARFVSNREIRVDIPHHLRLELNGDALFHASGHVDFKFVVFGVIVANRVLMLVSFSEESVGSSVASSPEVAPINVLFHYFNLYARIWVEAFDAYVEIACQIAVQESYGGEGFVDRFDGQRIGVIIALRVLDLSRHIHVRLTVYSFDFEFKDSETLALCRSQLQFEKPDFILI